MRGEAIRYKRLNFLLWRYLTFSLAASLLGLFLLFLGSRLQPISFVNMPALHSVSLLPMWLTLWMWLEKHVSSIHAHNHTEITQNPPGENERGFYERWGHSPEQIHTYTNLFTHENTHSARVGVDREQQNPWCDLSGPGNSEILASQHKSKDICISMKDSMILTSCHTADSETYFRQHCLTKTCYLEEISVRLSVKGLNIIYNIL